MPALPAYISLKTAPGISALSITLASIIPKPPAPPEEILAPGHHTLFPRIALSARALPFFLTPLTCSFDPP